MGIGGWAQLESNIFWFSQTWKKSESFLPVTKSLQRYITSWEALAQLCIILVVHENVPTVLASSISNQDPTTPVQRRISTIMDSLPPRYLNQEMDTTQIARGILRYKGPLFYTHIGEHHGAQMEYYRFANEYQELV